MSLLGLRFSTRYKICQQVLALMTEKATIQVYSVKANSIQEQEYKFTVMRRLGRCRSFVELRRLDLLPALQMEHQTSMKIMAFLAASKGMLSLDTRTRRLIVETTDEMTKVK